MMEVQEKFQAIIIGSGAGGGVVADVLSQKGIKTLIIESGPYRKKEHFVHSERQMSSIYYNRGGVFSKNMSIGLAAANNVGGSTSVYTGVSFRTPKTVLEKWRKSFGLDFLSKDYVDNYFDYLDKDLNIHELDDSEINENNSLFKNAAESLGFHVKKLKINTQNCKGTSFCNLGCTEGAKQGTLEVQIPRALKNGAKLVHSAFVHKVSEHKVYFTVSKAKYGTADNYLQAGAYTASADVIVIAAGVLNSPAILLRSQKELSLKNDNIGRYISLHPVFNLHAINTDPISNNSGFPKAYYIDEFSESEGYYLETSFYFHGVTAKNIPGWGAENLEIMKNYHKMMSILILSHDKSEKGNRISINKKGQPVLNYSVSKKTKESLTKAIRKAVHIFIAAGCVQIKVPGANKIITPDDKENLGNLIRSENINFSLTPLSTAHPQGGCRMGADRKNSVCDTNGKVWGTKNIYVADASLFPTSVQVNPYETVMLMANHVAGQISARTITTNRQ